jgi:hypothetical protein
MGDTMKKHFQAKTEILKVDSDLGLIIGFAMICKVRQADGSFADYYDTDGDHFTERGMLEASTEFAKGGRVACDMHARDDNGQPIQDGCVVHTFPLTEDIAKALGIDTPYTGLLTSLAPDNPETLEKARNGTYTGFSIGGEVIEATNE